MQWESIDSSELREHLVEAQAIALQSAALGEGQADPFEDIMPHVVSRMRAQIQAGGSVVSLTPQTVPPEIKDFAVMFIIEQMTARLVGLSLTEEQKTIIERGHKYMDAIAKGLPVSMPDDPAPLDVQTGSPVRILTHTTRHYTPQGMNGLT